MARIEAAARSLQSERDSVTQANEGLRREHERLRLEKEEAEAKYKKAGDDIDALKAEHARQTEEYQKAAKSGHTSLKEHMEEELTKTRAELDKRLKEHKAETDAKDAEVQKHRAKAGEEEGKRKSLASRLEAIERENVGLEEFQKKYEDADQRNREYKNHVEKIEREKNALMAEVDEDEEEGEEEGGKEGKEPDGPHGIPTWKMNPNFIVTHGRNNQLKRCSGPPSSINRFLCQPPGVK